MRYCKSCIIPDSRPNIVIGPSGECNACVNARSKVSDIDWALRERDFKAVVENARLRAKSSAYDCLIPVSGGKDSTWQVVTCLKYGLKPLAVTVRVPGRNVLGQKNLDNLISLGVDHIDYQIDPNVERKFYLASLRKFGATGIPMHMAMHAIPPKIALAMKIPLIVWGENSAFEYGTKNEALTGFSLDREWIRLYGNTQETIAENWISEGLLLRDMSAYSMPDEKDLATYDLRAIFLGYYLPWDVETSLKVALAHGFTVRQEGPRMGLYNYADIDDDFMSIHHWAKWYKFGFTRLFDNLSIEIRQGRMTRAQALDILKQKGTQRPNEDIIKFCKFVRISEQEFDAILESFRSLKVWHQELGVWKIKDFIIADWNWQNN